MSFFVFFHLFPEGGALGAAFGVFFVAIFDAPEALMFLGCLEEEIIYVVVKHDFRNYFIISTLFYYSTQEKRKKLIPIFLAHFFV